MSLSRTVALNAKAFLCIGSLLVLGVSSVAAEGIDEHPALLKTANRCTDFGPGFVDAGGGCARSGGHVRVGARNANVNAWSTSGTSNAGLRSDSTEMLRGAGDSGHLRVRNGLGSLSPFR